MRSYISFVLSVSALLIFSTPIYSQEAQPFSTTETLEEKIEQLKIGESFVVEFTIAKGDWGSSSADISTSSTYTAPLGVTILSSSIERSGHHSWASAGEIRQAGQLSYESSLMTELSNSMRDGFLKGALKWKGADIGAIDSALNYAKMNKEFKARFKFFGETNSQQAFRWGMDTKNGRHGAAINATAFIILQRVPSNDDAATVVEAIKFAIASDQSTEFFELVGAAIGGDKTSEEVNLTPPTAESQN